ncbi:MAG: peptidoglycan DD-metalloendopeptidase family protein [Pseudomonadales bacterium]
MGYRVAKPLLCLAALALWGCRGPLPAPVVEHSVSELPADGIHEVRAGETLYAIACRYGRDFRELAAINEIDQPYLIRSGERLRLTRAVRPKPAPRRARGASTAAQPRRVPPVGKLSWTWPANGKLVTAFGAQSKGIDVAGKVGDPVRAAAAGEVVYAGSGLRGYGNLVIVKHDANTLSAYGHNSSLSVTEGQTVKAGQQVAKMGRRGNQSLVHFEIRRNGKPLDPVALLPSR